MAKGSADILVMSLLMVFAALAAFALPEGSVLRWAFTLPVILVAPGYLLLQAIFVPAQPTSSRLVHGLLSLGISPALLGLLALSTALIPGGFKPGIIVAVVAVGSLVLAGVGLFRRARSGIRREETVDQGATSPDA